MFEIIITVISIAASLFGTVKLFKSKDPLYFKMVVCASWCVSAQLLYQICLLYCVSLNGVFSDNILSGLGTNSFAAFLFAANSGPLDSILDGKDPKNKKVRRIALAAPAIFLALTLLCGYFWCRSGDSLIEYIGFALISASLIPGCVYYNLKYLLIPDDGVFVRGVKPLNLFSLLLCFVALAEMFTAVFRLAVLMKICEFIWGSLAAATVLAAVWGRKKWKI